MTQIKLYGHYDSGHVYKVMLFLALNKTSFEYEEVDIWADRSSRQPDFLKHSRNCEVPLLMLDGDPYIQSNLILHILARHFKTFGGENDKRLLAALDWQFWEANRLGMCLPQLRYAARFAPEEFSQGGLELLYQRLEFDLNLLASHLSKGNNFMIDDAPSIADLSLCGYLFWADEAKVTLPTPIKDWLGRISQLEGWKPPYELLRKPQV